MKQKTYSILITLLAFILLAGCGSSKYLSMSKLQSAPDIPDWLVPVETDIEESIWAEYKAARTGYGNIKIALRKYDYLLKTHPSSDRIPFWLYMSSAFYMSINEDHLAYQSALKLTQLSQVPCTNSWKQVPELADYKNEGKLILLQILAGNKLESEFNRQLTDFTPVNSRHYYRLAQSFMLLGQKETAIKMLHKTLDANNMSRIHKKSSFTAGACAMAYAMGKMDKVSEFSQWMIDAGRNPEEYIPEDDTRGYYKNQWQSSYDIISRLRDLSQSGIKISFNNLNDGIYHCSVRGFLDLIDVT